MEHAPLLYRLPGGAFVNPDDIIGLFDLDTATQSKTTRAFLRKSEAAGALHLALRQSAAELPRVFLVTEGKEADKLSSAADSMEKNAGSQVFFLARAPR